MIDAFLGATVESADSPLGRWTAAHWSPPLNSHLHGLVEDVWYFDGLLTHAKERVFPDGRAELIVQLDQPHRDGDARDLPPFPAVCINGLRTRSSVVVAPRGRCRVLGIRFTPVGACLLVRGAMRDLVDVTVDLGDVLGKSAMFLGEQCADAADAWTASPSRNAIQVLRAAAKWLMACVRAGRSPDAAVANAIGVIGAARGVIALNAVGGELGIARAPFAQRFAACTGITPKRYARIVRFHNALTQVSRDGKIANAAADFGYADQSHMYRDFNQFAGMSPGAFLAAARYPGSLSLAET